MLCLICKSEHKKLAKAHIIPKSLYSPIIRNGKSPVLLSNKGVQYKQRIPVGIYDNNIICNDCEKLFAHYDTYAKQFFLDSRHTWEKVTDNGIVIGHIVREYNYKKLKLFFISLIFRASLSSHYFFEKVNLGELNESARLMIIEENPGTPEDFSVIISEFDNKNVSTVMLSPHRTTFNGIDFYWFYFSGFCPIIKVEAKATDITLAPLQLGQEKELLIPTRDFRSSPVLPLSKSIISRYVKRDEL